MALGDKTLIENEVVGSYVITFSSGFTSKIQKLAKLKVELYFFSFAFLFRPFSLVKS